MEECMFLPKPKHKAPIINPRIELPSLLAECTLTVLPKRQAKKGKVSISGGEGPHKRILLRVATLKTSSSARLASYAWLSHGQLLGR